MFNEELLTELIRHKDPWAYEIFKRLIRDNMTIGRFIWDENYRAHVLRALNSDEWTPYTGEWKLADRLPKHKDEAMRDVLYIIRDENLDIDFICYLVKEQKRRSK
jgi:hypothetical protein